MRPVFQFKCAFVGVLAAALALASVAADAQQKAPRIRGEIENVSGSTITVKTPDGKTVPVKLDDGYRVTHAVKASLSDIKPGDFVGSGAYPEGNEWKAAEVHIFPKGSRPGEGHRTWSSDPSGTMTNADVGAVVTGAGKNQLTLTTAGRSFKINVPPTAPVVRFEKGSPALVKKGAWVGISRAQKVNGKLTAKAITVSDDRRYPVN
ncbi:MAG TPA: hypothetical protein VFO61_02915 [Alphaproteobacteria bacterium]|nr:hypothetical protein [Alphaproteobacteria bacterium]